MQFVYLCVCVFYFRYWPMNLVHYSMLFLKLFFQKKKKNSKTNKSERFELNFIQINHHKQKVYHSKRFVKDVPILKNEIDLIIPCQFSHFIYMNFCIVLQCEKKKISCLHNAIEILTRNQRLNFRTTKNKTGHILIWCRLICYNTHN